MPVKKWDMKILVDFFPNVQCVNYHMEQIEVVVSTICYVT